MPILEEELQVSVKKIRYLNVKFFKALKIIVLNLKGRWFIAAAKCFLKNKRILDKKSKV